MKISHRGFIVPLLLIVIAALLAGGGYLYIQNQKLVEPTLPVTQTTPTTPSNVVKNTSVPAPAPIVTPLPTCTNGRDASGQPLPPVITSISKTSGPLGTQLEINGCNFAGFEGQKTAWIENSQGVAGMLVEDSNSTNTLLKAKLESPLCSEDNSFSGKPCTSKLNLTPGTYKIFTRPWGKKSNEVTFTVTAPGVTKASGCGMTISSPVKDAKVTFPLTISGVIDNRNYASLGCSWALFEGEAGSAQIYYKGTPTSQWSRLGSPVVVHVSDWMTAGPIPFSVTLNFNNDGIGLGGGTQMKVVFTDNPQKEGTKSSTLELPFEF